MQKVVNAFVCEGVYNDKPYKNGRIVVANYQHPTDAAPTFITVQKATPEIAATLQKVAPIDVLLYYDVYKNVVGYKKSE